MRVLVLHNLNYVDAGGVIHELYKGDEAEIAPADLAKCGSMVEVLDEPVVASLDEAPADKMVKHARTK